MKKSISLALVGLLVTCFAANAAAAQCEGVKFSDHASVDGKKLVLNGLGIREATIMQIDVYVAGLYVEKKSSNAKTLYSPKTAKRLTLHFVRDVDRSDVVDAYRESFHKAAGSSFKTLKPKLDKLLGWMTSIKEGQNMTYTYVPNKGVEVSVKGTTKGTLEGADFAEAFFKIWFGKEPPNSGLKTGLMGGECG